MMGKTELCSLYKGFLDCICLCLNRKGGHSAGNAERDADNGHLIYRSGDLLEDRYEIVDTLGEGTFGKVVQCLDHSRGGSPVALKIIKNLEKYREAAKLEINVLEKISEEDPNNKHHCVQMFDWFDYHGHVCISFELLSLSTFDFLKSNNFLPYPISQIRHMAQQICHAVSFLHDLQLTHTDLKPENILFVSSDYSLVYNADKKCNERRVKDSTVRLVDFGSATFDHEHHSAVISTRHYRAPEVILGEKTQSWAGVTPVTSGASAASCLSSTKDPRCSRWLHPHLRGSVISTLLLIFTFFCSPPDSRQQRTSGHDGEDPGGDSSEDDPEEQVTKQKYFHRGRLDWNESTKAGRYVKNKCKPLKKYLLSHGTEHHLFFDLLEKMLEYEPSKRIRLSAALNHPFFLYQKGKNQSWRNDASRCSELLDSLQQEVHEKETLERNQRRKSSNQCL
ncbi:dual specificity protein kinase CLK2b isoform X2 [Acanthochromis polyacanthus]|uniref:dual specificity protein kinase CLK2b isoform X2 n=1 Tax=Acanthochromis polyacanthus TaxID=80966 RepID=UPI00223490D5|nr:dual specificity protein kinase CLK2b isoform X2 [Acanthochromis polyacanthus]